ncbi:MAG: PspC domain-containing protein, partial [Jatrophihabitans sp.]
MPRHPSGGEDGPVIAVTAPPRRLYRVPEQGVLGGVAAGIADHLAVRTRWVRIAFAVLALAGGLGVALYGTYWIVLPARPGTGRARLPQWLEYLVGAVVAIVLVGSLTRTGTVGWLFVPTLLACVGGALIWRQATDPDRDRWARLSRASLTAG